jgi:hypothetical protein
MKNLKFILSVILVIGTIVQSVCADEKFKMSSALQFEYDNVSHSERFTPVQSDICTLDITNPFSCQGGVDYRKAGLIISFGADVIEYDNTAGFPFEVVFKICNYQGTPTQRDMYFNATASPETLKVEINPTAHELKNGILYVDLLNPVSGPAIDINTTKVGIEILSINSSTSNPNLFVELNFVEELLYPQSLFTQQPGIIIEPGITSWTGSAVEFAWHLETCSEFAWPLYELQVLRLYNEDDGVSDVTNPEVLEISSVDWGDALSYLSANDAMDGHIRDTLSIMQGTGYYIWRVRPIANEFNPDAPFADSRNYGPWSTHIANATTLSLSNKNDISGLGLPGMFYYSQFDEDKNWIYNRVFADDGVGQQALESIIYADQLLNPKQSQTYSPSNDTTVITQSVSDYVGRTTLSSLPVPVGGGIGFKDDFMVNGSGEPYSAKDFDAVSNLENPEPVNQSAGEYFEYYDGSRSDGVPYSDGKPFMRSIYATDGTGRLLETGLAGDTLGIKTTRKHTVRNYVTQATEEELFRMFGSEAPKESKVIKEMNVDQNGVCHISYKLTDGKVIATCVQDAVVNPELNDNTANASLSKQEKLTESNGIDYVDISISMDNFQEVDEHEYKAFVIKQMNSASNVKVEVSFSPAANYILGDPGCASVDIPCGYELHMKVINTKTKAVEQDLMLSAPLASSTYTIPATSLTDDYIDYAFIFTVKQTDLSAVPLATYLTQREAEIESLLSPIYLEIDKLVTDASDPLDLNVFYDNLETNFGFSQQTIDDELYYTLSDPCYGDLQIPHYECQSCLEENFPNFDPQVPDYGALNFETKLINAWSSMVIDLAEEEGVTFPSKPTLADSLDWLQSASPNPDRYKHISMGYGLYDIHHYFLDIYTGTNNTVAELDNDYLNGSFVYPSGSGSNGKFNTMIANMLSDTDFDYNPEVLCNAWTGILNTLRHSAIYLETGTSPDEYRMVPHFSLLKTFLDQVREDYRFIGSPPTPPYSSSPTEYLDKAYRFFREPDAGELECSCDYTDENRHSWVWADRGIWGPTLPDPTPVWETFYGCFVSNAVANSSLMDDFLATAEAAKDDEDARRKNEDPNAEPIVGADFTRLRGDFYLDVLDSMVNECKRICDASDEVYAQKIKELYENTEGEYISEEDILCLAEHFKDECITFCDLTELIDDYTIWKNTAEDCSSFTFTYEHRNQLNKISEILRGTPEFSFDYEYEKEFRFIDKYEALEVKSMLNEFNDFLLGEGDYSQVRNFQDMLKDIYIQFLVDNSTGVATVADFPPLIDGNINPDFYKNPTYGFDSGTFGADFPYNCDYTYEDVEGYIDMIGDTLNLYLTEIVQNNSNCFWSFEFQKCDTIMRYLGYSDDPVLGYPLNCSILKDYYDYYGISEPSYQTGSNKGIAGPWTSNEFILLDDNITFYNSDVIESHRMHYKGSAIGLDFIRTVDSCFFCNLSYNEEYHDQTTWLNSVFCNYAETKDGNEYTEHYLFAKKNDINGVFYWKRFCTPEDSDLTNNQPNTVGIDGSNCSRLSGNINDEEEIGPDQTQQIGHIVHLPIVMSYKSFDNIEIPTDFGDYADEIKRRDCDEFYGEEIRDAVDAYKTQALEKEVEDFREEYMASCWEGAIPEATVTEDLSGYQHFTLFYYDRAGRLIKTIPPKGFVPVPSTVDIPDNLEEDSPVLPGHTMATEYIYDGMGNLHVKHMPEWDDGTDKYVQENIYDLTGKLRFSVSPKQQKNTDLTERYFTYYNYDNMDRLIESGEVHWYVDGQGTLPSFSYHIGFNFDISHLDAFIGNYISRYTKRNRIVYTRPLFDYKPDVLSDATMYPSFQQENLRNRISYTICDNDGDSTTKDDNVYTVYSYDVDGNVKTMLTFIEAPGDLQWTINNIDPDPNTAPNWTSASIHQTEWLRYSSGRIDYEYDLISGKVKKLCFNKDRWNEYYQQFEYDENQRLTKVSSSREGEHYDLDAEYEYLAHGPLKNINIGQDKLQQVDYYYTINGWLKAINNTNLQRGASSWNQNDVDEFCADEFGTVINYFGGDYLNTSNTGRASINTTTDDWTGYDGDRLLNYNDMTSGATNTKVNRNMYNGNISAVESAFGLSSREQLDYFDSRQADISFGFTYTYDVLNRLQKTEFYGKPTSTALFYKPAEGYEYNGAYNCFYTYDQNGNTKSVKRSDTLNQWNFQNAVEHYTDYVEFGVNGNQLTGTNDLSPYSVATNPNIKNGLSEYEYDINGNMTAHEHTGSNSTTDYYWTYDNKVDSVVVVDLELLNTANSNIGSRVTKYLYDAQGNRVFKKVYNRYADPNLLPQHDGLSWYYKEGLEDETFEFMFYDASGNLLSTNSGSVNFFNGTNLNGEVGEIKIAPEQYVYGNSSQGQFAEAYPYPGQADTFGITLYAGKTTINIADTINSCRYVHRKGYKVYNIKDYLGNVRLKFRDIRMNNASQKLDLTGVYNYYPYGSQISSLTWESDDARFGFQGQQRDDEIAGAGVANHTHHRENNTLDLGWRSIDPEAALFPSMSPYNLYGCNPIMNVDPRGDETQANGFSIGGEMHDDWKTFKTALASESGITVNDPPKGVGHSFNLTIASTDPVVKARNPVAYKFWYSVITDKNYTFNVDRLLYSRSCPFGSASGPVEDNHIGKLYDNLLSKNKWMQTKYPEGISLDVFTNSANTWDFSYLDGAHLEIIFNDYSKISWPNELTGFEKTFSVESLIWHEPLHLLGIGWDYEFILRTSNKQIIEELEPAVIEEVNNLFREPNNLPLRVVDEYKLKKGKKSIINFETTDKNGNQVIQTLVLP